MENNNNTNLITENSSNLINSTTYDKINLIIETIKTITNEINEVCENIINSGNECENKCNEIYTAIEIKRKKIDIFIEKINNKEIYDEKELIDLLNQNNEISKIITLSKNLDEKIKIAKAIKEALELSDNEISPNVFLNIENDYINTNNSLITLNTEESRLKRKRGRPKTKQNYENMNSNNNNNNSNSNVLFKYKNTPFKTIFETRRDDNSNINNKQIVNNSSLELEEIENDDIDSNGITDTILSHDLNPTTPINKFPQRNRRPLVFCKERVQMEQYYTIISKLEKNPKLDLSLESSEYENNQSITLNPEDNLKNLKEKFYEILPTIQNDLKGFYNPANYLINNLNNLIQIRTLYYGIFDMTKRPPEYLFKYLCTNEELLNSINKDFKFVKMVLVRKIGAKIQNVIISCCNQFKYYILRKDFDGNTMIKGELLEGFKKMKNYFKTGIKGFDNLAYIQLEVYLHKYEMFNDYNEEIDKTNITQSNISQFIRKGKILENIRIIDKKIKMLEEKENKENKIIIKEENNNNNNDDNKINDDKKDDEKIIN